MTEQLTPLMKQYNDIKQQHQDAIVLFRLGDFYEMFGDDAKKASQILNIALTTRDKNKENPIPMCGIPYFASENYISKLIRAGLKVAICEQMEDPQTAKGIVKRDIVRVITPGTHTPESPKSNNYLMSIHPSGQVHGIALADISTGEFSLYETSSPIEDESSRFEPNEILIAESLQDNIHYSESLSAYNVSTISDWSFDYADAYKALMGHFKVATLEGFGCEGMNAAISAGGALISYISQTQKDTVRFPKITVMNPGQFMFLDSTTQRNLELVKNLNNGTSEGSLLWALDETLTPMGGRLIRSSILRPCLNIDKINLRLSAVGYLIEDFESTEKLRITLRKIQDIERLSQRVISGRANARDLIAIKNCTALLPDLKNRLINLSDPMLQSLGTGLPDLREASALIEDSIVESPPISVRDGGIIKQGYSKDIDVVRNISLNAKDFIAKMESEEKKKTGISSLKIGYNKIHGYYIEITKANLDLVPDTYIRKQTLVNGERFTTPELKEYEAKVVGSEERLKQIENDAFEGILKSLSPHMKLLMEASSAIAKLDYIISLAISAKRHGYVMPKVSDEGGISITGGRHPVVERMIDSGSFVPNDVSIGADSNLMLIITGPNMAGKSTYIKQVALITLMAQMGSFVPAEEAHIGVTDRIFTRIGASDFLTKGQSTFMVEMIEASNILNNATGASLILLDEIGRGTSTFDGISIAWASAEYIINRIGARTLFATHYIELTELSHLYENVGNLNIAVKEWGDEILFLRKIEKGPADKSYGIQVARLAGLPDEVVDSAKEVLKRLEKQHASQGGAYNQMDLFSSGPDSITSELKALNIAKMTPEQALKALKDIKRRL